MADRIAFIGAGNMAKSLVGGLLRHGYPAASLVAADPDPSQRAGMAALGVSVVDSNSVAVDRAADLAPTIAQIRATGATTLAAIADGLNAAAIPTPRGQGKWSPVQVRRTLQALAEGTFVKKKEPMRVD